MPDVHIVQKYKRDCSGHGLVNFRDATTTTEDQRNIDGFAIASTALRTQGGDRPAGSSMIVPTRDSTELSLRLRPQVHRTLEFGKPSSAAGAEKRAAARSNITRKRLWSPSHWLNQASVAATRAVRSLTCFCQSYFEMIFARPCIASTTCAPRFDLKLSSLSFSLKRSS